MIKKLISLALASVSTLALAGCGATDNPVMDKSLMGDGTSNKTGLGGYWWSYVDRGTTSAVVPNTGKKNPQDPVGTDLLPGLSSGPGLGFEAGDSSGNLAFHVTGKVGPAPAFPPPADIADPYWNTYSAICLDGDCKEYKYPSAGLGFGFKAKNVPLGDDGTGTQGVAFRIKVGTTHAKAADGTTPRPITVAAPMDYTDVPDSSFDDAFGTASHPGANAILYPSQPADANLPLCTFPGTLKPGSTTDVQTQASKTCFCNLTTTGAALTLSGDWATYCVPWTAFGNPGWGGLGAALVPTGGISAVIPANVIKLQFEAYKPTAADGATYSADFDFWVDDVKLLKEADWDKYCADKGAKVIVP